jgi:hypothetical protein
MIVLLKGGPLDGKQVDDGDCDLIVEPISATDNEGRAIQVTYKRSAIDPSTFYYPEDEGDDPREGI